MEYVKLGNSGLDVSRICLGTMSFGAPGKMVQSGSLSLDEARPIVRRALKLGINFFDTANIYSEGDSETILGALLNEAIDEGIVTRDELVIATKVYYSMFKGPNSKGLTRKTLLQEVENSLKRLGMDYIDLYIIHRLDHDTPVEEIMSTLHSLVESGKVRYIGASSMYAWQFLNCQNIAEKHGWTKFISMQDLQNLLYREEEREMIPLCKSTGVGMTPWSPLASGMLVRDLTKPSTRFNEGMVEKMKQEPTTDIERGDREIIRRVGEVADRLGLSRVQVVLGWLLNKPYVTAPIVGASKVKHVEDAVSALGVTLNSEDMQYLEEPYVVRQVQFFR